jgi:hypothetical protein
MPRDATIDVHHPKSSSAYPTSAEEKREVASALIPVVETPDRLRSSPEVSYTPEIELLGSTELNMLQRGSFAKAAPFIAVAAALSTVVMVAQGCSRQKSQSAEDLQAEQLPEVGTLNDYLASEDADQYTYVAYGPYDPLMFDPSSFPPYWYPAPVYYLHTHHHYAWPSSPVVAGPLREGGTSARTPTTPIAVSPVDAFGGGPGGAIRGSAGFGYGHTSGGGHR